ncbi:MAG: DNA internalization-related competence protein ComEC/Rec2 [Candidatus Fibromonas sp.]|jgi:competence protein ComEC|nr:DNA internalization-related competence protein ComEC/Rec2 [Candidatus Fibromonas sp.]
MENNKSFKAFFEGLNRYPAFAGAVSVLLALGATTRWQIAFLLAFWIYALNPVLRKVSFVVCAAILTSYFSQKENFHFAENPPQNGVGYVEEILNRPNGSAVILQTNFGKTRLTCSSEACLAALPGDSVFWKAKWFPVQPPTVPGAFNSPEWMRSEGFSASGSLDSVYVLSSKWTFQKFSFLARQKLEQRFSKFYAKPETALLMGLLAGDRSGISETLQNDFRKTGLVHVLSISGFHVVMLAGMLTLFLRSLRLPRKSSQILSIILLCIYAPVTGGSSAVWRAVLMFCVMECGSLFQKTANSVNALGVALIFILLFEPEQVFNAGFQLSAAATLGILLGQRVKFPSLHGKIGKLFSSFFIEASFVTLCATLSTLPLLVFHFQTFSPISWLGNLVVVPLVGLGMQAGVLSLVGIHPFICQTFADSATLLLRASSVITSFLAENPYASSTVGPWPLPCLFAVSILVSLLPFIKGQNPWGHRIVIFCLLFCSCFFIGAEVKKNLFPSWSAVFLDVGQGDCTLLKSPAGRFYLVDAGPPLKKRSMARDKIIPYFRSQGISEIDAMIISHPHLDHYGNAADILKEFPVRELWTTSCAQNLEDNLWKAVLKTAGAKGVEIKNLHRGLGISEKLLLSKNEWNLTVLYPDSSICEKNQNNNSIALKVQGLGQTLLLTGDLEKQGERELLPLDIKSDVLKLGHHGSKTSSTMEFLERTAPSSAIISVALKNRYRHPSKEILERLDGLGIRHYGTHENGSIRVEFSEKGYSVEGYQGKWSHPYSYHNKSRLPNFPLP